MHRNDQSGAVAHPLELASLQIRRQAAVARTGVAAMQRLPGKIIGLIGMSIDQAQQPLMKHFVERGARSQQRPLRGGMPRLNRSAGVPVNKRASGEWNNQSSRSSA